jgi:hypothetical protein
MSNHSISFAVTVCDEYQEIQGLLKLLLERKKPTDEIVVLVDLTKNLDKNIPHSPLLDYLHKLSSSDKIVLIEDRFNGDFAVWKNRISRACTKDYILQLDADELPSNTLLDSLDMLLSFELDLYLLPRENTVEGITEDHIRQWRWKVDSRGWINYPDFQGRLYRNKPEIVWKSKVHEYIIGYQTYTYLYEEDYRLVHSKTIQRQEKQNQLYSTL